MSSPSLLKCPSLRYQRQQRKDGLLPHRTETLTLSPSRIKAHHPKCPKLLSHVLAGQLAPPKYPLQKASNIPPEHSALKMPLNVPNTPPSLQHGNNTELLNSNRNYNHNNHYSCNLHAGGKKSMVDDHFSTPDLSELSNAERSNRQPTYGAHMGELPPTTSTSAAADPQKTILLKIPNVSESEQLLVSEITFTFSHICGFSRGT